MSPLKLFRLQLTLRAPLGTPMNSGTLFGQLCWIKREAEGEAALVAWLVERETVWAISDGFPRGLLPRPLLAPSPRQKESGNAGAKELAAADEDKQQKKLGFVTREGFLKTRARLSASRLAGELRGIKDRSFRISHNTIDRNTGSTPETGGLFFLEEDWSFAPPARVDAKPLGANMMEAGAERDIYISAPEGSQSAINMLFKGLGEAGFGRDASLGRGQWHKVSVKEDNELAAVPPATKGVPLTLRHMSLSHGTADGFVDMRCKLMAHYGKTGPGVSDGASPFKRPLLLARPGATFGKANGARAGEIIAGVHHTRPEIIHNGLHVCVPFYEEAPLYKEEP